MDNNKLIEILNHRFEWTRNNSLALFIAAEKTEKLKYKPEYKTENPAEDHTLLYQFQCLLTTADTHFRKVSGKPSESFGVLIDGNTKYKKEHIPEKKIENLLTKQKFEAKEVFSKLSDENLIINTYITLIEHENLHQGQLVVMFRLLGIPFPSTFKEAWNV